MSTEEMARNWVEKMRRTTMAFGGGQMVYDAEAIEAMVAEILQDGFKAGVEVGTHQKREPRKQRRFHFDVAKLQADARAKMLKEGRSWQDLSDDTGIAVNALKQHLGEKPPVEMGLRIVVSLLVYLGDFDVLGYLLEEEL